MRRAAAEPPGPARLAVAAAGLLTWLVVRSAAIDLAAAGGPVAPARLLAPGSAAALIHAAGAGALRPGAVPGPARQRLLARAAARAPLRYEPFLARALADVAAARWDHAIRAGEAARAREPRAPVVRGLLLGAYLRRARYPDALGELRAIVSQAGMADGRADRLLALIARAPGGAAPALAAVRADPRWRAAILADDAIRRSDPALTYALLLTGGGGERDARAAFLRELVDRGEEARAYLAWVALLMPAQVARAGPVYDGDFRDPDAPAPFNWSLRRDGLAVAERTRATTMPGGTALAVRYFGAAEADIAVEILMLPPGRYTFSVTAAGAAGTTGEASARALRWELTCRPSARVLSLGGPIRLTTRPVALVADVTLPPDGCGAQQLALRGTPDEVAVVTDARFAGLRLDRR